MHDIMIGKAKLIDKAIDHLSRVRAAKQRETEETKSRKRADLLETWKPHIEAIREALPEEARDGIQEPIAEYSRIGDDDFKRNYSPVEVKIAHLSLFAWHYQPHGACQAQVFFEPGHLKLDPDDLEIYHRPASWSRSELQSESLDFFYALGLADEDWVQNHDRLVELGKAKRQVIAKAEPTPKPTTAEELQALIRSIVRQELLDMEESI